MNPFLGEVFVVFIELIQRKFYTTQLFYICTHPIIHYKFNWNPFSTLEVKSCYKQSENRTSFPYLDSTKKVKYSSSVTGSHKHIVIVLLQERHISRCSMATLSLRINIVENNVTKTMQFDPTTSVYDACRIIREKIVEANQGQRK